MGETHAANAIPFRSSDIEPEKPHGLNKTESLDRPRSPELLMPTRFVPPVCAGTLEQAGSRESKPASCTPSHIVNRRAKGDIYFTPTDVTRSQIFFSNPLTNPLLVEERDARCNKGRDNTIRPQTPRSRQPSRTNGPCRPETNATATQLRKEPTFTPTQVDQVMAALAKSRIIQKHVREWDEEIIPDGETATSSYGLVATPTLTSATSLYTSRSTSATSRTQRNPPAARKKRNAEQQHGAPQQNRPFGGVALTDPSMHGSPIRFLSRGYNLGAEPVSIGSCTFANVPCGAEVECTLRVSSSSDRCRVLLQCANQIVHRRSGSRSLLLLADVDVTAFFTAAALALLVRAASVSPDSPATAALASLASLRPGACPSALRSLLASLDSLRSEHRDVIVILRSGAAAATVPWISRSMFQNCGSVEWLVRSVVTSLAARKGADAEEDVFAAEVPAENGAVGEKGGLELRCVPMSRRQAEKNQSGAEAWVCFVQRREEREGVSV